MFDPSVKETATLVIEKAEDFLDSVNHKIIEFRGQTFQVEHQPLGVFFRHSGSDLKGYYKQGSGAGYSDFIVHIRLKRESLDKQGKALVSVQNFVDQFNDLKIY